MKIVSERGSAAARAFGAIKDFNFQSRYAERRGRADIADFTFGNPHEMPLPGLVEAIREGAVPRDKCHPDGDRLVLPQCGHAERAAAHRCSARRYRR